MKWWWMVGSMVMVSLLIINAEWYGNAATFGVPIGWMITILVLAQFRKPTSTRWVVLFGVISVSIGIVLSVPGYSVAEAKETLNKTYDDVTYMESVPTTGAEWNPFTPRVGYRFETRRGESILFIPDSGKTFEL
ncbi:hypothetical protein ACFQO8_10985 [Exiguobacterium aestuarii]|uniref:Uncharacterized protein n=1 Tax=Exiguobacterium aestuarii TaxID=273527 RepID=A0ABW2PQT9_9BACL|nr:MULTISPECIES: hypothetical protein [Exiguobacterium]MCT4785148.1 hypothetical protein [Exiguobacterium aestuarii]